ncbi:hypothetical protein FKM82_023245 [Ascaphus truei]
MCVGTSSDRLGGSVPAQTGGVGQYQLRQAGGSVPAQTGGVGRYQPRQTGWVISVWDRLVGSPTDLADS